MKILSFSRHLFVSLIEKLNNSGVGYAIIGDYLNLPESIEHDIDIWTDDVTCFRKILFSTIADCDFHVLIDNKTANGCNVAFYKRSGDSLTFMKIDVLVDTSYKSVITLVGKDIMAWGIQPYNDFYVLNQEVEALGHFLYPLFEWGCVKKEKYKVEIKKYCQSSIFRESLTRLLGNKLSGKVLKLILLEQWDEIYRIKGTLKAIAIFRAVFCGKTYKKILKSLYCIVSRIVKPSGKCLAFCGLDGAGKTTILDELNSIFVNLLKQKKVYYAYWRPFVIPEIRELFGMQNSKSGIALNKQKSRTIIVNESKPKNPFISLLKLNYYCLDYMLAPLKYGGIRSRGGMILFDRHYIDMIVHPQRFEMKIPQSLLLFFYYLIPKADFTFFLYCTPEEIHQRKQEFSKGEITEQIELYNNVGKKIKNFIPIHTNTSIAEEIDEILMYVSRTNYDS